MFETSADVLDALRAKLGAKSDRELARHLGCSPAAPNHWRVGRVAMSPEIALRAAELLGAPPELMLLRRYAELEKDQRARAVLRKIADGIQRAARKAPRAAAIVALASGALAGIASPAPANAAERSAEPHSLYILSNRRRPRPWSCRNNLPLAA